MRRAAHLLLPLILTATLAAPILAEDKEDLTPMPDKPMAPGFDLKDNQDKPQRLADYRGKPVILNFWATWCPPCREEMPSMQRAHQALSGDGIAVIAINVGDDAETIGDFLAEVPVDFPLPMDTESKVAQSYPLKGLPTTYVIDPQGRLVYAAEGEREWDDPKILNQVRSLKQ